VSAATGCEWLVEAHGCDAEPLRDIGRLAAYFDGLIRDAGLHPVAAPAWHQFPGAGGVTGMCLLSESHIACHTFPEYGSLCLNLFCCRPRPEQDFAGRLAREFGAKRVEVRRLERRYMDR
jgi:S-adenosylmethionine decarboxylase